MLIVYMRATPRLLSHLSHLISRMSKPIAIIAGVGPGTGASVARRFAREYPVALLARTPANYEPLVTEINKSGGKAVGIQTDVTDKRSIDNMVEEVNKFRSQGGVAAAIYNAAGGFVRKPFLELEEADLQKSFDGSVKGAFFFSQAVIPLLQSSTKASPHPPSLIFTGATASVKGSARFAAFATMKFALRAMAQSLAREFGPEGVHIAHAVIDGVIDIPRTKDWDMGEDGKISPEAIADAYWWLSTQPKSAFTWEIDIRPGKEKW